MQIRKFFVGFIILFSVLNSNIACAEPTLKVYTFAAVASRYGSGPTLKAAFEKQCQCKIQWIPFDTGVLLLNRLKWEGEKTKADVVMGLDSIVAKEALELNLFESLDFPPTFEQTALVPYSRTCLSFIYDQKRLTSPPQNFEDLMSGKYKLLLQDPRTSGTGMALVVWIRHLFGDQAPAMWQRLQPHILTFTRGWSEAYTLFQRGEGDLVLSYMTSPLYHEVEEGKTQFRAVPFQEGNITLFEMVGVLKTSSHKELGERFISFLRSKEGQRILATKGWQYPLEGKPSEWDGLITYEAPNSEVLDPSTLDRVGWVEEWQQALDP